MDIKLHAKDVFYRNRRFDLIYKLLYLEKHFTYSQWTNFYEDLYCEHIKAFNNFYENDPDYKSPKDSRNAFINSFNDLFSSIKTNGFNPKKSNIQIDPWFQLPNGSHRVSICTHMDIEIPFKIIDHLDSEIFDFAFFKARGLPDTVLDYGAVEHVEHNPNVYVIILNPVANSKFDRTITEILQKYGFILYVKEINLSYNGYVNLKKLCYGSDPSGWIGTPKNSFAGAQDHAKRSMGNSPLRAMVYICDSLDKVKTAKEEIRKVFNLGNFSVHINDSRDEAIQLAQNLFHQNSLWALDRRPFLYENRELDNTIERFKKDVQDQAFPLHEFCIVGSGPMSIFGLRDIRDIDFFHCGHRTYVPNDSYCDNADKYLQLYPLSKGDIIFNPNHHFYYSGVKFALLQVIYELKQKRGKVPKDVNDCKLISDFVRLNKPPKPKFRFYKKEKRGQKREITICGLRFTYTKRSRDRY